MKNTYLLAASLFLLPFYANALEISPAEKEKLTKGELVKDVEWRKDFVWPKVTIKALIPGTPEANMKGFSDFESHKTYIPDLIESKVVKTISPTQFHVYCELKVPWPVNKSVYTTNNVITSGEDGSKTLTWNLVKAKMIKATDGYIKFTPYEGKSYLEYQSQIVPNSSFAGMFKSQVEKDVEASVKQIIKHLGKSKK